ncbi:AAA family ATPase [Aeromonas salmonicida]|uniref:AAA family ATPase n=1 Tax=Aeromonas salmonicida TaxID=645 RepID=UPI000BB65CFD|nr:DUF3696 domain-containing protein [Aeromonas salmonicida]PBO11645.1 hypothetical protein CI710_03985 [Aeromonas salmonicida]
MISSISITNFKSHQKSTINTKQMTLLTGINGMGKSSVFQSLLLLRQTHKKNMLDIGLELKGDLCDIGTARDALYQSAADDFISFFIKGSGSEESHFKYYFDDTKQDDTFLRRIEKSHGSDNLSLFSNNFQYISAFRNGPVADYERDTSQVEYFRQISLREGRCELTAHYLSFYGKEDIVDESLKSASAMTTNLHENVQSWMNEISPGIQINIESLESSFKLSYQFSRGAGKTPTEKFKAKNIGFGISYVLPIVIAALHSPKGSLILIENPEAHIHPAGQSKLMELLSLSAKAGIQFIIETHSDHIINGALIAINKDSLSVNDVSIYFFERESDIHKTIPHELNIITGGKIRKPPKGFFDQIKIDMQTLMGF